ncbi:MAG: hypothetical protein KDA84_05535 [Planctomycetaceae bacterium]|nr:hypothetical protein [Planctomycetaceae bacterium]
MEDASPKSIEDVEDSGKLVSFLMFGEGTLEDVSEQHHDHAEKMMQLREEYDNELDRAYRGVIESMDREALLDFWNWAT